MSFFQCFATSVFLDRFVRSGSELYCGLTTFTTLNPPGYVRAMLSYEKKSSNLLIWKMKKTGELFFFQLSSRDAFLLSIKISINV